MAVRDAVRHRRAPNALVARAVLSLTMVGHAVGHVLPRQTAPPSFNIELWPLLPTPAPMMPAELRRRDFNTVCGYIGGNPDLPATCLDGSHCVVDTQHNAIGCCPDEGDCTTGIYTDCVDENSPPNGVVDPHVFTCGVGDVCYKNTYQGGYFQYGCGSSSGLATNVALSASGKSAVEYESVSVSLRPTTTMASGASSAGAGGSSTSGGASRTTGTGDSASKASATDDASSGGGQNTSAIIGGTIGGVAVLILLLALGVWFWRRKKKYDDEPEMDEGKYISRPMASPENDYDPTEDMAEARPAPKPPTGRQGNHADSWPIPPTTMTVVGGTAGLTSGSDSEQVPLTRDINDSSRAAAPSPVGSNPVDAGAYNAPRRGGERPFWQQTGGGRTRNLTRS